MPPRSPVLLFALLLSALSIDDTPTGGDRRIVDTVQVGDARSEAAHGYWGVDASAGASDGGTYRETRGAMRYALTTFDDTEVTVACTFAAHADGRRFALVVEDSVVASQALGPSRELRVVQVVVPMALTHGKTNIAVALRAQGDLTPPLRELRTIQDHNELDRSSAPFGAPR